MKLYSFDSSSPETSPFAPPGVMLRLGPFLAVVGVTIASMLLQIPTLERPEMLSAFIMFTLAAGMIAVLPWKRMQPIYDLMPPAAFFAGVGLLNAADGNHGAGFVVLALLPIIWFALYGTRGQLLSGLWMLALTLLLPGIITDGPMITGADAGLAMLWVVAAGLIGFAIHQLVSEAKWHAAQWERQAQLDPLTQLPNRAAVERALSREIGRARRTGQPLTVAYLDLDHFKKYNDTKGHQAGDELLKGAAVAWQQHLRSVDLLGRIGGEEFVVLLPDSTTDGALAVLERLRIATPDDQTFSAGAAVLHADDTSATVLHRADQLLYDAKRLGRSRTVHEDVMSTVWPPAIQLHPIEGMSGGDDVTRHAQ